jgi:hypothetical protein
MTADDERRFDAITWRVVGKRYRECSAVDLALVLTYQWAEIADQQTRIGELTAVRARQIHVLDQFDARMAHSLQRLEALANGGRP